MNGLNTFGFFESFFQNIIYILKFQFLSDTQSMRQNPDQQKMALITVFQPITRILSQWDRYVFSILSLSNKHFWKRTCANPRLYRAFSQSGDAKFCTFRIVPKIHWLQPLKLVNHINFWTRYPFRPQKPKSRILLRRSFVHIWKNLKIEFKNLCRVNDFHGKFDLRIFRQFFRGFNDLK